MYPNIHRLVYGRLEIDPPGMDEGEEIELWVWTQILVKVASLGTSPDSTILSDVSSRGS
jgi:hypothetical protein